VVGIVAANFHRDPDFFRFQWKLGREAPVEVRLSPARHARIIQTIEAPGKVEADTEVKISSQVVGRIVKLPVREGDVVKKDDLLVQLDTENFKADVRSAEARVQRLTSSIELTEADVKKSRRDLDRGMRLYSGRAVSQSEFTDTRTLMEKDLARLAMCRAELKEAESALSKANEDLRKTEIRSPVDGIISSLLAKAGEVVIIGTVNNPGTVIMEISDPDTIVVRARVDETNVPLVRPGQRAVVHLLNDDKLTLTGAVKRISPRGTKGGTNAATAAAAQGNDNEPATFETIIALDTTSGPARLGMTASVEIQVAERADTLTIPAPAVLHRRARDLPPELARELEEQGPRTVGVKDPARRYHQVVFVHAAGKASCRLVQTGISDDSRVEILAGLHEGEQVIAGPYRVFDKLKDGKAVIEMATKDGADD
jgi:HlyD family secretion protein